MMITVPWSTCDDCEKTKVKKIFSSDIDNEMTAKLQARAKGLVNIESQFPSCLCKSEFRL